MNILWATAFSLNGELFQRGRLLCQSDVKLLLEQAAEKVFSTLPQASETGFSLIVAEKSLKKKIPISNSFGYCVPQKVIGRIMIWEWTFPDVKQASGTPITA